MVPRWCYDEPSWILFLFVVRRCRGRSDQYYNQRLFSCLYGVIMFLFTYGYVSYLPHFLLKKRRGMPIFRAFLAFSYNFYFFSLKKFVCEGMILYICTVILKVV